MPVTNTDLQVSFARLEGKIDTILLSQAATEKRLEDHATRIRSLEDERTARKGVTKFLTVSWGILSAAIGASVASLIHHFTGQ